MGVLFCVKLEKAVCFDYNVFIIGAEGDIQYGKEENEDSFLWTGGGNRIWKYGCDSGRNIYI